MTSLQTPFDVSVVIPTVLRPDLMRAVHSVFAQDFKRRIQIMIGVDKVDGDPNILDELRAECPENVAITVIDPGYSTAQKNGGLYSSFAGGSLRTVLSYAANSRYLAYLDDDNWWAPHHLGDLFRVIGDKVWAFSLRWLVDINTRKVICEDDFIAVGPGRGIFKKRHNGLVDTNCLLLDKLNCGPILHLWSHAMFRDQSGEDRRIFEALHKQFAWGETKRPSVYYTFNPKTYDVIAEMLAKRGYKPSSAGQ